jgi:uncharacterized membrane protein YphA (DoxX/SURF4 family)
MTETRTGKFVTRYLPSVARVLMGLLFTATGAMGLLLPAQVPDNDAAAFTIALQQTGYMLPLLMGTELLVGLLLLANRFVPLALALIAPVVVNIFALHIFLAQDGLPVAIVVVALELYLVWSYRKAFLPMLAARTKPGTDR